MVKRTFDYTVTGSITIDEADLRAAYLALPFEFETEDPTLEQRAEESMEVLTHAQLETPERLVQQLLLLHIFQLRGQIRPGEHSMPEVRVVQVDD